MSKQPKEKISDLVRLRRYFFAGLATLFPLLITLYAVTLLFNFSDRLFGRYANAFLQANYGFMIPGLGLVFGFLVIVVIGMFSMHVIGKAIWPFFEFIFSNTPVIKNIYQPAKQFSGMIFTEDAAKKFARVVLVEYPIGGSWGVGFVTNENLTEFNEKSGQELVSILVPTPPSPLTGYLVIVSKEKVKELNMSFEEAIGFIMSSGVVYSYNKLAKSNKG